MITAASLSKFPSVTHAFYGRNDALPQVCTLKQIHSARAIIVDGHAQNLPEGDALVTKTPGFAIGVKTADCAPVLFFDPKAKVIGAAHAGWKGAKAGILECTIVAMEEVGANRTHILTAIGPCIQLGSYEVGKEFYEDFLHEHPDNTLFFEPKNEKYHFNLAGYVEAKLRQAGIGSVENCGIDTLTNEEDYSSFRRSTKRGEAFYGNQLSSICLC